MSDSSAIIESKTKVALVKIRKRKEWELFEKMNMQNDAFSNARGFIVHCMKNKKLYEHDAWKTINFENPIPHPIVHQFDSKYCVVLRLISANIFASVIVVGNGDEYFLYNSFD